MTKADVNYLKEDMQFHGTLGRILFGMPQIFNGPPILTFPGKVASEAMDFRYGHLLQGGRNELLDFINTWLSRCDDNFCICHDMDIRRGDDCLIQIKKELCHSRIMFCSDEVYYCVCGSSIPSCDELDLLLRLGSAAPMLMCMGQGNQDLFNGLGEEISADSLRRIVSCSDYLIRGICDGEAFAGFYIKDWNVSE